MLGEPPGFPQTPSTGPLRGQGASRLPQIAPKARRAVWTRPQIALNSFGRGLEGPRSICKSPACAEHGAPVGRSPPRSTTRKRKVRREGGRKRSRLGEFAAGPRARPLFCPFGTRACAVMRSRVCEK
jgi:hypothetical protein